MKQGTYSNCVNRRGRTGSSSYRREKWKDGPKKTNAAERGLTLEEKTFQIILSTLSGPDEKPREGLFFLRESGKEKDSRQEGYDKNNRGG